MLRNMLLKQLRYDMLRARRRPTITRADLEVLRQLLSEDMKIIARKVEKTACTLAAAGLAILVGVLPVAAEEMAQPIVSVIPVAASQAATLPPAAKPALALEPEIVAPIQAVSQEFGGKHVLAYYTRGANRCDLVVMTNEDPVRASA
jgi:hypothetical protein